MFVTLLNWTAAILTMEIGMTLKSTSKQASTPMLPFLGGQESFLPVTSSVAACLPNCSVLFHHSIHLYLTFPRLLCHWLSPSAYTPTVESSDLLALATTTAHRVGLLKIRKQSIRKHSLPRLPVTQAAQTPTPDLMRVSREREDPTASCFSPS